MLYLRQRCQVSLIIINVTENKVNCKSVMNTAGLGVAALEIGDFYNFNPVIVQDLAFQLRVLRQHQYFPLC
jgi:hypothetical protein